MKNRGSYISRCFVRGFLPNEGIPYFYAEIPQLINVARFNWIRFWRSGENLRNMPEKAQKTRLLMPGVVINLMHRNHTLDYKWCNDLLEDMDIPYVG